MYEGKTIFITGGTGSWGYELVKQLLPKEPKNIIIFSRGELGQVNMQRMFANNSKLNFIIGDIRDQDAVDQVFLEHNIDYVFHLAALKHVPVCEGQPQETIKTNITGTVNMINCSIRYGVKKFIYVSTDKAVTPSCFYGLSKAIGEKLTISANGVSDTIFMCVRGGNVLGSTGSVIPHFIKQIKTNNHVTITDSRMTRFFITLSDTIALLFEATEQSKGGDTYVMNMPSFYIKDLASVIVDHYGNKDTNITEIGSRPGEKLHEELFSKLENAKLINDYFIIDGNPSINGGNGLSSEDNVKSKEFLKDLLTKGGFLM